jgi:hypothetical protein
MPVELTLVKNDAQIRNSLDHFNVDARSFSDVAESLLRSTRYWVFDPKSKRFGPGKFVGFVGMNFNTYRQARQHGSARGKFDGGTTRLAIEKVLERSFIPDSVLAQSLKDWASRLLSLDAMARVSESKWRFLKLGGDPSGAEVVAADR